MVEDDAVCTECGDLYQGCFVPGLCSNCIKKNDKLRSITASEQLAADLEGEGFNNSAQSLRQESEQQIVEFCKTEGCKLTAEAASEHRKSSAAYIVHSRGV